MRRIRPRAGGNAPQKTGSRAAPGGRCTLRIIGGEWRGRRIRFPDRPGLRPTPDRVRETLFNWLSPRIADARCLDLFAGSGALGLEALSRGAAEVVFVESDAAAACALAATVMSLTPARGRVVAADALAFLHGEPRPFDVVFLDPPFGSGLLAAAIHALDTRGWLTPAGCVYVEAPAADGPPAWPGRWREHRSGRAGAVAFRLALAGA
ncbi:MAG: 16S rRNA (guanine(966)-N(2))-methyltransferase RsmD, partial [Gammaproteobacteria bacterium]|nr:16S rRNA (guanine(966)-N(2))-methyltransferase RsmD [Gammaproteobacteria bacterium]